jgi:Holliday junction DNA helicase RuvA
MIARLTGTLVESASDHAVLDVNGVGYLVLASSRTLTAIGPVGGQVMLLTELQVREDSMTLFGFGNPGEREWFRLLTGVQGVGGRVALSILSTLAPDELTQAVARQDKVAVSRANGVGPKLAERIVRELKDKVGGVALGPSGAAPVAATGHAADAASALTGLGFKPAEANAAVVAAEAELGDGATLDALVRMALKKAAK